MKHLPALDLAIIVGYLASVVGLGLWLGRKLMTEAYCIGAEAAVIRPNRKHRAAYDAAYHNYRSLATFQYKAAGNLPHA